MANREKAKQFAKQFKTKTIFENSKSEFFTSENLAVLSEGGNKDKVTTHQFDSIPDASDAAAKAEKEKAALIAKIGKAKKAEEVDSLVGDNVDADVVTAANDKKAELGK
jgi:hypothetical protein